MAGLHRVVVARCLDHYAENTVKHFERTKADAMRKFKHVLIALLFISLSQLAKAQDESTVGKFMRSTERSYVVIAVMLTILVGLIIYLVRLDRKIGKLEREK